MLWERSVSVLTEENSRIEWGITQKQLGNRVELRQDQRTWESHGRSMAQGWEMGKSWEMPRFLLTPARARATAERNAENEEKKKKKERHEKGCPFCCGAFQRESDFILICFLSGRKSRYRIEFLGPRSFLHRDFDQRAGERYRGEATEDSKIGHTCYIPAWSNDNSQIRFH